MLNNDQWTISPGCEENTTKSVSRSFLAAEELIRYLRENWALIFYSCAGERSFVKLPLGLILPEKLRGEIGKMDYFWVYFPKDSEGELLDGEDMFDWLGGKGDFRPQGFTQLREGAWYKVEYMSGAGAVKSILGDLIDLVEPALAEAPNK